MAAIQTGGPDGVTLHGIELVRRYAGDVNPAGLRHGKGKYEFPNPAYTYEGDFESGRKHGAGTFTTPCGGKYVGDFVDDEITGRGERVWGDGRTYDGTFKLGEMHGEGTLRRPDGGSYTGEWAMNKRHGRGTDTHGPSGDVYVGEWQDDMRHGCGKSTLKSAGDETYDGEWQRNLRHGRGQMANASTGETYSGEWHEGKRHGEGKGHHASSGVDYVGEYVHDDPSSIPDNCDVEVVPQRPPRGDDEPEPELDEGEDPPAWGSEKDPMRVTQGEGVPGPLRLTVRLPYVPPPPPTPPPEEEPTNEKEESGEEGGEEEAPGDGDEEENEKPIEPPKLGEVASHESGRRFQCFLHAGAPTAVETDPGTNDDASVVTEHVWSYGRWTYGDCAEKGLSDESSAMTFTASDGHCEVDGISICEDTEPGVYTLVVRDVTAGRYGELGRVHDVHVVIDVKAKPEPEEAAE